MHICFSNKWKLSTKLIDNTFCFINQAQWRKKTPATCLYFLFLDVRFRKTNLKFIVQKLLTGNAIFFFHLVLFENALNDFLKTFHLKSD